MNIVKRAKRIKTITSDDHYSIIPEIIHGASPEYTITDIIRVVATEIQPMEELTFFHLTAEKMTTKVI
jgi:hypothetical protein